MIHDYIMFVIFHDLTNQKFQDRWNVMDFFMNSLYLATISTKFCAYYIHKDIPHEYRLR